MISMIMNESAKSLNENACKHLAEFQLLETTIIDHPQN